MIGKIRLALILLISIIPTRLFAQAPAISYPSPQTYHVNTSIVPLSPANTGGAVPVNAAYGQVTTFAGSGTPGNANGIGTAASFNFPHKLAINANKDLYVFDGMNLLLRKITPNGTVSTFAGNGLGGNIDGPAANATVSGVWGMAFDYSGNLYISCTTAIRKITPAGVINLLAGNYLNPGYINANGTTARFNSLEGICTDAVGNIFAADFNNKVVREITPGGEVSTYAGNGAPGNTNGPAASATFNGLVGMASDAAGNLYITESGSNRIRKISSAGIVSAFGGSITGVSGHDDGPAATATFNYPDAICTDEVGNVYVTEDYNNDVRKISTDGQVTTIAGNYNISGDVDAIGTQASFSQPAGIAEKDGQLYVADALNNKIRLISLTGYTINKPLPPGLNFDGKTGIISGTPTATAAADDYIITAYNTTGSSGTTLNLQVLAAGALPTPVITFTIPANTHADANGNITPNGTSTSSESPIYYTSSDPTRATITPDGLIHLVGAGPVTITAHQDASANYNAAIPVDAQITIIRSQNLTFPPISDKTPCNADFPANINTSSPSGNAITYGSSNTNVATISNTGIVHIVGPGTATITAVQAASLYYLEGTSSQTFTVSQPVNPRITISPDPYIPCYGVTMTFTASVTNAGSNPVYQWAVNGIPVLNNNTNTLSGNTFQTNDLISCKVTNTTDCSTIPTALSNKLTFGLRPNITPTLNITSSALGAVCSGSSVTFTSTSNVDAVNASYQWLINGNNSGTDSPTFTTTMLNDGDLVTCKLTASTNACAIPPTALSNEITAHILPNEVPSVTVNASATNIYANDPVTFTATVTNITANPLYQWQINGINAGTNSPVFTTDRLKNNDEVTCTITSASSCVAPSTSTPVNIVVIPPPTVSINNTFTPNGDGVNDTWNIPGLDSYPNCLVSIFDRSGSMVYQSNGYSKPWDGTRNSHPLPTGTYYYLIKLRPEGSGLSGSITIIR